jgi:3-deoxy-D-arabino-heptulosonate 7-phosphate (DAHP) synthase
MPENQIGVLLETIRLRNDADNPLLPLCGCMIESYLETGSQPIPADPADLKYGLSITDPCLGWDMTASALAEAYKLLGEKHLSSSDQVADATGKLDKADKAGKTDKAAK